ncbi:MAG: hypothetical protein RBU37_09780 [Myxococcota bacterium]|jgi:hypothetical protein|nr:hypothetical protein [Myxococcota bacterium]
MRHVAFLLFFFAFSGLCLGCGSVSSTRPELDSEDSGEEQSDVDVDLDELPEPDADSELAPDEEVEEGDELDPDDDEQAELSCNDGRPACAEVCCGAAQVCAGGVCKDPCSDGRAFCGPQAQCCLPSFECILDQCVPGCGTVRCGPEQLCCAADERCDESSGSCVLACPTQVFCGPENECCEADEICFVDSCARPGDVCMEDYQCPEDSYCEGTIGRCLPIAALPPCTYVPVEDFAPQVEWEWTGSAIEPTYVQVMMAPMVANLTDDNGDGVVDQNDIPDVVFSSFPGSSYSTGVLRIVSGEDGHEIASFTEPKVAGASSIALGDLDRHLPGGDATPEIVAVVAGYGGLVVFKMDGSVLWSSPTPTLGWGGAALIDLDQDGVSEVLAGSSVFDHLGNLLWTTAATGCGNGRNLSVAADVNLDPQALLEVVTGKCVLDAEGNVLATFSGADGFPAIGNFDDDPYPEIVVVASGTIYSYEHTGELRWAIPGPGGNLGPPTVGNFIEDDPSPEIAIAGSTAYVVIDEQVQGDGSVTASIVFSKPTQDASSNVTGSSIFDFEGDGVAEAVYNDECFIHVYDTRFPASDPRSDKFKLPNTSGTTHEYPIIVDVDNDGNAELIAIRNDYSAGITSNCTNNWPDFEPSGAGHGLRVFGDRNDNWVSTRRIWNQHAYWVTNIQEDGIVPAVQQRNVEIFNNFRQNSQREGLFFAPDLVLQAADADITACPTQLELTVELHNDGAQGVGIGLPVSFYLLQDGARIYVGTAYSTRVLLPGNFELLSFSWSVPAELQGGAFQFVAVADDPGDGSSVNNECDESNNELLTPVFDCKGVN